MSSKSTDLDLQLVDFVCNKLFPNFNINQELLSNWQVDLIDNVQDLSILTAVIEEEVVVGTLMNDKLALTHDHMVEYFRQFHQLDDEVYGDFKIIMTELISVIFTMTYSYKIHIVRCNIHKLVLDSFLLRASRMQISDLNEDKPSVLGQLMKLSIDLLELGCDTETMLNITHRLMKTASIDEKLVLLQFMNNVFTSYSSHFKFYLLKNFATSAIAVPFGSTHHPNFKTFSIHSWFKINHQDLESDYSDLPLITLFKISNSSSFNSCNLKIQLINYNQFMIEITNEANQAKMQFSFNQILNVDPSKNQGFTHFVLTFDKYSNFNLFVDGEYSESIPCPEEGRNFNAWDKLYFGDDENDSIANRISNKDEMILRNLTVLDVNLSNQWINLFYNLGLGYEWNFKEFSNDNIFNLLDHLSFKGLCNVALKFKEITGKRKRRNSFKESLSHFNNSKSTSAQPFKNNNKYLANGLMVKNLIDKSSIANSLISTKFKDSDIVFSSNDNQYLENLENPFSLNPDILIHKSESMHGAFYIIGGTPMILRFIETVIKDTKTGHRDFMLVQSLNLLFSILNNSWRLSKEFENISGYGILSIILANYKSSNRSLEFNISPDLRHLVDPQSNNLLSLILNHTGYDFVNPTDSVIVNPNAYRFLVLDFDLFNYSSTFSTLLTQFNVLMTESNFREFNLMELNKMKLLKKFFHFLKSSALIHLEVTDEISDKLVSTYSAILKADISVENIRAISHFLIYCFYSTPTDCNQKLALLALKSLTDTLCDSDSSIKILKKFSRSITIHWILLILNFTCPKNSSVDDRDVVICGIRLLARLLSILGPNVIKKFFEMNRGLDILTHFLKDWWSNDEVLCQIYLAAFGINPRELDDEKELVSLNQLIPLADDPKNQKFNKLVIPEFLYLLNNLVLNSVYKLSESKGKVLSAPSTPTLKGSNLDISLDAIHLISSYAQSIEKGYNNIKPLSTFYLEKNWLDGVFELIGYLRLFLTWENSELLQNFGNCYNRLIRIMTNIFISKLFNSSSFFEIFSRLNDFSKKLILETIFPRIFDHINEFISLSNFIFNEKEFMNDSIHLLLFYNSEFVNQNFSINEKDLSSFVLCILSILEAKQSSNVSSIRQLRSCLGELVILKMEKILKDDKESRESSPSVENLTGNLPSNPNVERFNETVKLVLERQMIIFQADVLNNEQTAAVIVLLLGSYFKILGSPDLVHTDHLFNLLRTVYMMRQENFQSIIGFITKDVDYSACLNLVNDFFNTLITKNDEETLKLLSRFPTYKHIFNQRFYAILSKANESSKIHVQNIISVSLSNGGHLGQLDNIYIKSFERDCSQLRTQVMANEMVKFNRVNQDNKENILYFATSYNSLKIETERLYHHGDSPKFNYTLDFIENSDRMRKRLVIEDQLSDSEKLAYKINIPLKSVPSIPNSQSERSFEVYKNAIDNSGINTLSLSSNDIFMNLGDESFEIVDDLGDTVEDDTENEHNTTYEDKNRKVLRSLYLGDHIVSIWNISQINGLAPIESLMILGSTHVYVIENYFHQQDGNVIDAQDAPLELRDPYVQLVNTQSAEFSNHSSKSHKSKSWSLDTLSSISKRQFLLRDVALEMFFTDGASILLTCFTSRERDSVYNKLYHYCVGKGLDYDLNQTLQLSSSLSISNNQSTSSSFAAMLASAFSSNTPDNVLAATKKWKNGEMSNFYYLIIINTLAGRTFNDLTQYPVFPWVIADYTSEKLDLSKRETFRDLSKPMGAQTEGRASEFRERYEALSSLEDEAAPAFHYGTHYSSAMIVTSFLIRLKPYVHSYLLLQGGKFDHADRLFNSIEKAWLSASKDNTTDVRELIPEFFFLPEFLVNDSHFEFGTLQNGDVPNNVVLPKWAHGDPMIFIQKNREALESPYVSANLHLWIDLVFGWKQSGSEAVESLNVFHHLSYNGAINLDNINDEMERKAAIGMINNFGQTPNKIFTKPHHKKDVLNLPNYYLTEIDDTKAPKMIFESKLRSKIRKIEISSKTGKWIGRPNCVGTENDLLIRKLGNIDDKTGSIMINNMSFLDLHSSFITCILQIGYKKFLTASDDGLINIWKCNTEPCLNLQFHGILRGHTSSIQELKFSKSFKVGLSSDSNGNVIMWDFVRFKFMRCLAKSDQKSKVLIDISNDSGNVAILSQSTNTLKVFSLNGDYILETQLPPGTITSLRFGSINNSGIETGKQSIVSVHAYWSDELISFAYGGGDRHIDIYNLKPNEKLGGWELCRLSKMGLRFDKIGDITAYELMKKITVDPEDKLTRGYLSIIMGDCNGRVFQW
ncbi:beige protein-like 1 [Yamadazyma tenuis]|uniref:Beige protein homolog 1 n=1 Tax=Candida tenuis (strain ATCC 10573 / BCRC 21748 / CBS 615 / JCM 9827 / NBRC 10315 / NRRL Y-1498 / VKM Y-70) TaxID=590646 RepID=G3AX52_CANTC|nr:beach-domain-containing protein [Yamadazyma tenuis ATCC 10573]EGV66691.1 beach-domain-containing protein [Yamadazyma tenuis ATCC 10573]WEJ95178.1 beige protein-like 1 [Yamadazyma tenuis]